jgi:hypothetical protein
MKTISNNNMDVPRTKEEWEEYYKLKKKAEKPFNEDGSFNHFHVDNYS